MALALKMSMDTVVRCDPLTIIALIFLVQHAMIHTETDFLMQYVSRIHRRENNFSNMAAMILLNTAGFKDQFTQVKQSQFFEQPKIRTNKPLG